MAAITKQQLEDASRDADDLGKIVNGAIDEANPGGEAGTVDTRLGETVRTLARAIYEATARAYTTWAGLNAIDPYAGGYAQVIPADAGTHTDPVTGDVGVPNEGFYKAVLTGTPGWQRIGSSQAALAAISAALAQSWAEGTTPGGPGTKSAKEWATSFGSAFGPGKNLANPALIIVGKGYNVGSNQIVVSANNRTVGPIPVTPLSVVSVSGVKHNMSIAASQNANETTGVFTNLGFNLNGFATIQIPADCHYLWVVLHNNGGSSTTYDGTVQVEYGGRWTDYEAYTTVIQRNKIDRGDALLTLTEVGVLNLIKPSYINYKNRYSTSSKTMITDTLGIASIVLIGLDPGFYTLSGDGAGINGGGAYQGGLFTNAWDTVAQSNIGFFAPPTGPGKVFEVPAGINKVVLSLRKAGDLAASTSLYGDGKVQLEKGEVATAWQAYASKWIIPESYLPDSSGGDGGDVEFDAASWYPFIAGEANSYHRDKLPIFTKLMMEKMEDVTAVHIGTSIDARTTEHHVDHPQASTRPPLMHSINLASHIWDTMLTAWQGQKYARYDAPGNVSEPVGSWAASSNLSEWDDGAYRAGLTRYSETNGASVSFTVPVGTKAWRFIHRTDSVASSALAVAITGGNGLCQVYDEGTTSWTEANGYTFSQREPTAVGRVVSIPNPDTDVFANQSITTKGNTTYQKRLKFRWLDTTVERTITITNTVNGSRFNYWGAEWSPREFMLTYVNAARGSHNTQASVSGGLPRYADNEVHSFKPNLIMGELPIHNDGAAGINVYATHDRWGRLANNYVFRPDYELSLLNRADTEFGYTPEIYMYNSTIAWNFGGIGADGQLLYSVQTDGVPMSPLDRYDQAAQWWWENHPDVLFINLTYRWVEAAVAIFGNLKTATDTSGKDGPGMTNDGSHPNTPADKMRAKIATSPFNYGV